MLQACYGHTEGAAGLTGALAALAMLNTRAAPAVMCLRTMNPHVGAALDGWASAAGSTPLLPRQSAPNLTAQPVPERLAGMLLDKLFRVARGKSVVCVAGGTSR